MATWGSKVLLSLWLVCTCFFSYMYSYPLDPWSNLHFAEAGTDIIPAMWVFNWQLTHLASGDFEQLFTGNAFYPLEESVLFSVNLLSTAFLSVPLYWVTGDFFLCYRVSIFCSFVLCSVGMLLLSRQLKLGVLASIIASLVFAFSEYRLLSSYANLAAMQWMPFTLLYIHKYFNEKRARHLYCAAIFFGLQTTACETYLILFSIIAMVFILILCHQNNTWRSKVFYRDASAPVILALIPALINYFPYWEVSRNYGFERSIATQAFYGLPLDSFFLAPGAFFFEHFVGWFEPFEGGNYPVGYVALMLTSGAILALREKGVGRIVWMRMFDIFLFVVLLITFATWQFQSDIFRFIVHKFPYLKDNYNVILTAILSPIFILFFMRLVFSKFIRSLYLGVKKNDVLFLYTVISLLAFFVSLGPVIKTHGQNYLAANPIDIFLFHMFPGFSAIRAISRMGGLIPLGLGISAAISFTLIRDRINAVIWKRVFSLFVILFLVWETIPSKGLNKPLHLERLDTPLEYVWLKNNAVEGPVMEWPSFCFICDSYYMLWSVYHGKTIVNGYGSWQWDGLKKVNRIENLSDQKSILSLHAFGVRYLFVRKHGLTFPSWAKNNIGDFYLIKKFENAWVYENKNAQTQFMPQEYWENFLVSYGKVGENLWNLTFTFSSPEKYYINKQKILLSVEVYWEDGSSQNIEISLYPTLWQNGDTLSRTIKSKGQRIVKVTLNAL
jgi:hypothetical protein